MGLDEELGPSIIASYRRDKTLNPWPQLILREDGKQKTEVEIQHYDYKCKVQKKGKGG